jgi:hypothetical protein
VDGSYDPDTDTLTITDFALMHAALVASPADTGARLQAVNTIFKGFETRQTKTETEGAVNVTATEEPIDNEVTPDGWQW